MVSQFLEGLGKKKHAKVFLDEVIDGLELLNAKRDVFEDLGVKSNIECALIAVSFKRQLMGVATIHNCSVHELIELGNKLEKHEKALDNAGVDVDMLLYAREEDFLTELLKEVGITKALDRNRFETVLKIVSESSRQHASSEETIHTSSEQEYVAYSTPV